MARQSISEISESLSVSLFRLLLLHRVNFGFSLYNLRYLLVLLCEANEDLCNTAKGFVYYRRTFLICLLIVLC